jgi:hypothetical protein
MKARVQLTTVAQFLAPALAVRATAMQTRIATAAWAAGHTPRREEQAPAQSRASKPAVLALFGACEGASVVIESSGNDEAGDPETP